MSPRVGAQRQPWDQNIKQSLNPERVRQPPNPFRVGRDLKLCPPRVLTMLEPWAEISERLRRNHLNSTDAVPNRKTRLECNIVVQVDEVRVLFVHEHNLLRKTRIRVQECGEAVYFG